MNTADPRLEFACCEPALVPMALLLEADPSEAAVNRYLAQSHCIVARRDGEIVGACLLLPRANKFLELMNIAVDPAWHRQGIGAHLLRYSIEFARSMGAEKIGLGTGTFGYQLAFYQRAGFRVVAVKRNHFLNHYDEPIFEDGIQHRDRLWLELPL